MADKDLKMVRVAVDELLAEVEALRADKKASIEEIKTLKLEVKEQREQLEQIEKDELAFYISSQRNARKMNYSQFARLLGSNEETLKNYEKGKGLLKNMEGFAEKIKKLGRVKK